MSKPTKSEEELKSDFDSFVEKVLPQAKLVAYSELVGGNYLMKKECKFNAQGDVVSEKYVVIPWEDVNEVTVALNFLLNKETHDLGDDYYMISQRPPSHRFWESMMARTIGKPIDQMKVEQNVNLYSETVEAAKQRTKNHEGVPTSIGQFM